MTQENKENKLQRPSIRGVPVDRIVGETPDGKTVGAVGAVNPGELPSDKFLLALIQHVVNSGEGVVVIYDGQENIIEYKSL